jgi:hypothetical protein
MFVGKMDTMKWTDYMDECLEIFEKSPEIPTDETLAVLVRLQRINDEAQELLVKDAMADVGGTPTWMFRKGMKERLDNVRNKTRPELTSNGKLDSRFSPDFPQPFLTLLSSRSSSLLRNGDPSRVRGPIC